MSVPVAHDDFVDLVACLNAERCDFVIAGAHALARTAVRAQPAISACSPAPAPRTPSTSCARLLRFGAPLALHGARPETS
jgi:hypothetical protein